MFVNIPAWQERPVSRPTHDDAVSVKSTRVSYNHNHELRVNQMCQILSRLSLVT
jgi:hypothetical protein